MLFCVLGQHREMSRKQQFFFLRKMLSGTDSHFVEEIMKIFHNLRGRRFPSISQTSHTVAPSFYAAGR